MSSDRPVAVKNSEVIGRLRDLYSPATPVVSKADLCVIVEALDGAGAGGSKDGFVSPLSDGEVLGMPRELPFLGSELPVVGSLWREYTWDAFVEVTVEENLPVREGERTSDRRERIRLIASALEEATTGHQTVRQRINIMDMTADVSPPVPVLAAAIALTGAQQNRAQKLANLIGDLKTQLRNNGFIITKDISGQPTWFIMVLSGFKLSSISDFKVIAVEKLINELQSLLERAKQDPRLLNSPSLRLLLSTGTLTVHRIWHCLDSREITALTEKVKSLGSTNIGAVKTLAFLTQAFLLEASARVTAWGRNTPAKPLLIGAAVLATVAAVAGVAYYLASPDEIPDKGDHHGE